MSSSHTLESSPPPPSWRTALFGADTEGRAGNASWSAILAGVVVMLAVLLAFSLVTAAAGLGVAEPASDDPFDNVGWAVGLTGILGLAVALSVGGFVAGALAVRGGLLHGLATWAASTLALVVAVVMAVSGIFGIAGSLLGSVGSALGSGAGSLASAVGNAAGASAERIGRAIDDLDTSAVSEDVQEVLRDTGVPELQPAYLQRQIDQARADIADAARELVTDPGRYEEILDQLATSIEERVDAIVDSVDREAIANAVAQNTELSEAEAQEAVDNAVRAAERAADEVRSSLDSARDAVTQAREEIPRLIESARETLDDASDAAARAALWAFAGLIIGALITSVAGLWGSRVVVARTETGRLRFRGEATDRA